MESRSFQEAKSASPRRPRSRSVLVDVSDHVPGTVSAKARPSAERSRSGAAPKKPEQKKTPAQAHEYDALVELRSRLQNPVLFEDVDDPEEMLPKQEGMRAEPRREVGWGVRSQYHAPEAAYWSETRERNHRIGKVDDDFARNETQSVELANAVVDLFGVRKAKKLLERVLKTGLERDVVPMDLAIKQALVERLVSCPPLEELIEQPYHKQIAALLPAFRALYRGEALGSDKTPVDEHVPEDWMSPPKPTHSRHQHEPKLEKNMDWKDRFYADLDQAYVNRDQAQRGDTRLSEDDHAIIWMQNQGGIKGFQDQLMLYVHAPSQTLSPWIERLAQRYPEAVQEYEEKEKEKVFIDQVVRRDRYQPV